jgi:hypothetical protein
VKCPTADRGRKHPRLTWLLWEIFRVTMISIADRNRLTVRGVRHGQRYLVKKEGDGWWIEAAPRGRRRVPQVAQSARDLTDHLDALAAEGFAFEPVKKENVPSCRF